MAASWKGTLVLLLMLVMMALTVTKFVTTPRRAAPPSPARTADAARVLVPYEARQAIRIQMELLNLEKIRLQCTPKPQGPALLTVTHSAGTLDKVLSSFDCEGLLGLEFEVDRFHRGHGDLAVTAVPVHDGALQQTNSVAQRLMALTSVAYSVEFGKRR